MIAVIDYGVGNLRSVEKAFEFIGYEAEITSYADRILEADAVVLPGVGAFSDGIARLKEAGLADVVKQAVAANKPFLGICLGMQMLFDYSEEGGKITPGLGIFKGAIKQIPPDMGLKVPHMGWNSIEADENCLLFKNVGFNPFVYFVHSFYLKSAERDIVVARTKYGIDIDAAVAKGRIFATQFHPEKSGHVGLEILKSWAGMIGQPVI